MSEFVRLSCRTPQHHRSLAVGSSRYLLVFRTHPPLPSYGDVVYCTRDDHTPLWFDIDIDCYRCYVFVTRLVIGFLLVDQQNSAKLFAFESVVRCFYDAPLMVVISPFSMTL